METIQKEDQNTIVGNCDTKTACGSNKTFHRPSNTTTNKSLKQRCSICRTKGFICNIGSVDWHRTSKQIRKNKDIKRKAKECTNRLAQNAGTNC